MEIVYFYENFLSFTKKFLPPSFLIGLHYLLKKPGNLLLKEPQKNFLKFSRTPSAKRLTQTQFFRFWLWFLDNEGQRLWESLFLQILQVATKIGIYQIFFSGNNFTSKNFKELSLVESFFNIKQDYGAESKTLLNSITNDLMRVFCNSCNENFGKLSEKNMWCGSLLSELHEYSLQPTTGLHYKYFLRVLRKGRMF